MIRRLVFALSSIALLSACSSSPSSPTPTTPGAVSIPVGAQALGSAGYNPDPITISTGSSVTWTNMDTTAHTATSDSAGLFDSGNIAPGGTFSHTFTSAGTVTYHCTLHQGMVGTIFVH